jgi:RNA polymerase primary sigma factor
MGECKQQAQSSGAQCVERIAEEQGYVTVNQVLEAFPEAERSPGQLDDLFHDLYSQGIRIYETKDEAEGAGITLADAPDAHRDRGDGADLSRIPVNDGVGLYLAEMGEVPLLTYDEEVALAAEMERGEEARRRLGGNGHNREERTRLESMIEAGRQARKRLIEANTRLVVSVAKRYRGMGVPFLDLIQAGNVGLLKAADRFDHRRGHKFATYATWWIRQAVTRFLSDQGRTIRLPIHLSERIRRVFKVARRLEQDMGRRPTAEEIAGEIPDLDPDKARWLLCVARRSISLDKPIGDDADSTELGDLIEDEAGPSPSQLAERHLLRESLERMLVNLTPREDRVLRLRFGLNGDRARTLREVGDKIGVTRERVRQIEASALRKLRHPRHSRILKDYLG